MSIGTSCSQYQSNSPRTMSDSQIVLRELLEIIAEEEGFSEYDIEIKQVSSDGANYSSTLHPIKIKNSKKELCLFAKIAAIGPAMREALSDMNIYEAEAIVYRTLMPAFRLLEDKYGVPEEHRLSVAKFYGASTKVEREILVLEDLTVRGFQMFDRFKSMDWNYASAAVTELAKFHALSMAYYHYHKEEYTNFLKECPCDFVTEYTFGNFFYPGLEMSLKVVRPEFKERFKSFLDTIDIAKMKEMYGTNRTGILNHTDYRPSNLMHRCREDGKVDIIPMDYQTIREGNPVTDLLYLIFLGSDQEFRRRHYQQLVDYYYVQLRAALTRLGLSPDQIYSREDFDADLKEKLPYGLTVAASGLSVITVESKDAPAIDGFSKIKTGALFPERVNEVVEDFIEWGVI